METWYWSVFQYNSKFTLTSKIAGVLRECLDHFDRIIIILFSKARVLRLQAFWKKNQRAVLFWVVNQLFKCKQINNGNDW